MSIDLRATYRVQFHAGFGFADAAAIADYLAEASAPAISIARLTCRRHPEAPRATTWSTITKSTRSLAAPGARSFDHGAE